MSILNNVKLKKVQLFSTPANFFILIAACSMPVYAGDIILSSDVITFSEVATPDASCNCEGDRQPPWHGSAGERCCNRPCCPPPTHFHADAFGQLRAKAEARSQCVALPATFPRFHKWRHTGRLPSPEPIAIPRCHHCGAHIPVGM